MWIRTNLWKKKESLYQEVNLFISPHLLLLHLYLLDLKWLNFFFFFFFLNFFWTSGCWGTKFRDDKIYNCWSGESEPFLFIFIYFNFFFFYHFLLSLPAAILTSFFLCLLFFCSQQWLLTVCFLPLQVFKYFYFLPKLIFFDMLSQKRPSALTVFLNLWMIKKSQFQIVARQLIKFICIMSFIQC